MRAKPSAAHLFYANMLIVASVAISESVPDGVAVDTLNATPTSALTKRYLKSHADITTSGHTNDFEERVNLSGFTASLDSIFATPVAKFQAWKWQQKKEALESLLDHLKFNNNKGNPFEDPDFFKWITFVKRYAKKTKEDPIELMFRILSNQYKEPATLAKVLLAGTKIKRVKRTVDKLLDAQIESWKRGGKSSKDVFRLLKLYQVEPDKLFESTVLSQWVNYVKMFNPEAETEVMLEVLRSCYNEDGTLAKALVAGTKIGSMENTALKLLDAQIESWERGGKSSKDVFRWLMLDQVEPDKLFESLVFSKWVSFVKMRFGSNKESAIQILFAKLSSQYENDAALAEILLAGTKFKSMEDTAVKLLDAQLNSWNDKPRTANEVFESLALHEKDNDLLFSHWLHYVKNYLKPSDLKVIKMLKRYNFSDEKIATIFPSVDTSKAMSTQSEQMKTLQAENFQKWMESGLTPAQLKNNLALRGFSNKDWNEKIAAEYDTFYKNFGTGLVS